MIKNILTALKLQANEAFAQHHARFFKTQQGGYGEGDQFWGLRVPAIHAVTKQYYQQEGILPVVEQLLASSIHEVRFCGLDILVHRMQKAKTQSEKDVLYSLYMANLSAINNWDLVDCSAGQLAGRYWYETNDTKTMWQLAKTGKLWQERIAIIANKYHISKKVFYITDVAEYFLNHKHDLIHKAVGWMLREAGKQDETVLLGFLDKHAAQMPRTMLRYSIERLEPQFKAHYMQKK